MDEKKPFEDLLKNIGELLDQVRVGKLKHPSDFPPDLELRIANLEKNAALFTQFNKEFLEQQKVESIEIQNTLQGPKDTIPLRELRLLERIEKIKKDAEAYSREMKFVKREIDKLEKSVGKKGEFGQKRKKKFKAFGNDERWIPM